MDIIFIWFWILVSLAMYLRGNSIKKKLVKSEGDKHWLDMEIDQIKHWCAYDSPEIGCAMSHLQLPKSSISGFRDKLRKGEFTFGYYKDLK